MVRRFALVLASAAVLAAAGAAPASALKTHACKGTASFRCGTVVVPLDRTGAVPGTVKLSVAIEVPRQDTTGYLLALSGGPGQPSVPFADSFRASLAPALAHRRLVLLDQRGTGESGALSCKPLQALGTLDVVNTVIVQKCMDGLGPRRRFYSTTDSVLDIEAVREAVRAPKLELMGVSYGTYVAEQYARRFPARTDGLILDSIVPADGIDAYFMDTFARLPRVIREQCARDRCAGATTDAYGDLAQITKRLQKGALRGPVIDAHGQRFRTAIHDESELLLMIMSGDLNPFMQAVFPGAIASAVRGDAAPLLRLRRLAQGPPTPVKEFSSTLNVATTCADVRLPYTMQTPFADRWNAWRAGTDGLADSAFAPFSRHAVVDTSVAHDCLRWPEGDVLAGPSGDPLPDVPALILSGRLDTRTPLENARETLPLLPHAQLLTVPGTGHDVLDSDITGCAAQALRRFADGRAIGTPCRGKSNAVAVMPRAPKSVADYRAAPKLGKARGRVLFAVLDTLNEVQLAALETLYAGFDPVQGGGLRAGRFSASGAADRLRLHGYSYVPGVTVSGRIRSAPGPGEGTVTFDGPGRLDGRLHIDAGGLVTGTIAGRHVHYHARRGLASSAASGHGRMPMRLALPSLHSAAMHLRAKRR